MKFLLILSGFVLTILYSMAAVAVIDLHVVGTFNKLGIWIGVVFAPGVYVGYFLTEYFKSDD